MTIRAIILAAGRSTRLYGGGESHPHKALLRFGGESLLARHLRFLRKRGIDDIDLVVGYMAEDLLAEVAQAGAADLVRPVHNPDYKLGTSLSLWCAREQLVEPGATLIMDADVLYHPALLDRLLAAPEQLCLQLDRDFEDGDEPVKVALRNGAVSAFGKVVDTSDAEIVGEWPGFMKVSAEAGARLAERLDGYVRGGRATEPMENAVRDILLSSPSGAVGCDDVTGIPWIEIDFPSDVWRAASEVMPRIERFERDQTNEARGMAFPARRGVLRRSPIRSGSEASTLSKAGPARAAKSPGETLQRK